MVKVKGVEWSHVIVIKEPEKHGMATSVRCIHCDKEFQGNAMRIRAHLLGNKRQAGVTGCTSVPDEAREELHLIEIAREQTLKKRKPGKARGSRGASSASDHSSGSAEHADRKSLSGRKGDRSSAQHNLLRMSSILASIDLDSFFDGFGLRPETVLKIKEMGFTAKTLLSNLDELSSLLGSINEHHRLTLGEEWGIKGAAKKWQREQAFITEPEVQKWPDSENTCKEVELIETWSSDTEEVTQLDPYPKWMQQQQQGQQLRSSHKHAASSSLTAPSPNSALTDVGPGGSPGRVGYYTNLLTYQAEENGRFEMIREVDISSQRQPVQVRHPIDHGATTTF